MSEPTDLDLTGLIPDDNPDPSTLDTTTELVRASLEQRDAVETIAESVMETDEEGNPTDTVLTALQRQAAAMERMADVLEKALERMA